MLCLSVGKIFKAIALWQYVHDSGILDISESLKPRKYR